MTNKTKKVIKKNKSRLVSFEILKSQDGYVKSLGKDLLCTKSFFHRLALQNFLDLNVPISKNKTKRNLTRELAVFSVPRPLYLKLKILAKENNCSMSHVHREALNYFFKNHANRRK